MIIIPARLNSTRFKDKILCKIDGVPMFIKTALNAKSCGKVLVACDDDISIKIARSYNLNAIITKKEHESGTDRIQEAVSKLALDNDEVIINLQADEPFFEKENLMKFIEFSSHSIKKGSFMASCFKYVTKDKAKDPNLVKLVTNINNDGIYFSRSLIPYPRNEVQTYKVHIGIYAYSVINLKEFCSLKTKELENAEKLEQLRAIQSGKRISMLEIKTSSLGIDTIQDLKVASQKFGFTYEIY